MERLGKALYAARVALDLTQEDAAERIGISSQFYGRIERGHSLPSVPTLARMVRVLGVSANALTGRPSGVGRAGRGKRLLLPQAERPELRRVVRQLRKASPETIGVVTSVVDELNIPRDEEDD